MKIEQLHQLFLASSGVTTDTRNIKKGQLFFALKGDNFNGNNFAQQAIEKGAAFAIIDEKVKSSMDAFIVVDDVLTTLQHLAGYHRRFLSIPILAITGSNGKTTSKELIHAVLRKKFSTLATAGNLNNHIGVPLTLLSMKKDTEFGIVEMGANHHGEIANLCKIAQPDYGYITNFGKAHIEGFGSLEGVIQAKSELYNYLKENEKIQFLNLDDPTQRIQFNNYSKTYSFGTSSPANVIVDYLETNKTAEVAIAGKQYKSSLYGSYNAINIAASVCIGNYFKVPAELMEKAILSYVPSNNRSQLVKIGKTTILMDAYNANPTSMKATLESFQRSSEKDKVVILGDMFELGKTSAEEHQAIAEYVEEIDLKMAFLVGENFSKVNTSKNTVTKFENYSDLAEAFKNIELGSSYVLVKGSRGMALERLLEVLKAKE